MRTINLTRGDALLIVDVQNDFLPGGSLGVPGGDAVIEPANLLIELYCDRGLPVYASRDWHPLDHCSFAAQGGPWPPHCVADTHGAAFADALALPADVHVISKGTRSDTDGYSALRDTGLPEQLRAQGVTRLAVCGLATDYCVLNTVNDALAAGFQVMLVRDAVRAVEVSPGDGAGAIAAMADAGAQVVQTRRPTLLDEAALVDPAGTERPQRILDAS